MNITSRLVPVVADDIDTDQIIPARFLKVTSRKGLGAHLFADRPDFATHRPESRGATILLAGVNFGCGSSREHAPWALVEWGFRAVIARSFADIFRQNALKNGLVPVAVDEGVHRLLAIDPTREVSIDVREAVLELPGGGRVGFLLDPFARRCLVDGLDELAYLRAQEPHIAEYEKQNG
jgi:3-isopropylmalate/(R)-2-methylmalate dehydratase small subunit